MKGYVANRRLRALTGKQKANHFRGFVWSTALILVLATSLFPPASVDAGTCRLVVGDNPGVGCCNACCDTYNSDMVWCRILRWFCRSCGEACALEAWNAYTACALQCAIDFPQYISECEYED